MECKRLTGFKTLSGVEKTDSIKHIEKFSIFDGKKKKL